MNWRTNLVSAGVTRHNVGGIYLGGNWPRQPSWPQNVLIDVIAVSVQRQSQGLVTQPFGHALKVNVELSRFTAKLCRKS